MHGGGKGRHTTRINVMEHKGAEVKTQLIITNPGETAKSYNTEWVYSIQSPQLFSIGTATAHGLHLPWSFCILNLNFRNTRNWGAEMPLTTAVAKLELNMFLFATGFINLSAEGQQERHSSGASAISCKHKWFIHLHCRTPALFKETVSASYPTPQN